MAVVFGGRACLSRVLRASFVSVQMTTMSFGLNVSVRMLFGACLGMNFFVRMTSFVAVRVNVGRALIRMLLLLAAVICLYLVRMSSVGYV